MTEPREALQPDERELARLNHSGTHSCRGLCPGRFLVALEAAEARLAAGVHLGDEGLREAAQEVLAATGDRPPEGPEPTTAEVERWYIANDSRIIRALAALALAAQENPAPARSAPSLDEGLLARAMHAVTILEPGLLSDVDMLNDPFEGDPLPAAKAVAREYRRLAQEGETP